MPEQRSIDDQSRRPDSRFLEDVANEVHLLFFPPAPPANMQRFKDQVRAAIAFQKRHDEPRAKLERQYMAKVKRDARLRDRQAGPPTEEHQWDGHFSVPGVRKKGAWVPSYFLLESDLPPRPIRSGVCPPDIPWEIGLPGRYVILGIVHDNSDHATRHYRPELLKDFDLPLAFSVPRDCRAGSGTGKMGFADFDRDSIKRALIDVKADLASHQMQPGGGAATAHASKRYKLAYDSYQWACAQRPDLVGQDRGRYPTDLYEYGKQNWPGYAEAKMNLPAYGTWTRYVREYERLTTGPKNTPRGGRTGRSVLSKDDL